MSDYGVTDKGFVLKRADVILDEVYEELSEGFKVDVRSSENSLLKVLVMTFVGQIADLWETAQESYYAKYPSTATGVNLDNAVQYGGVRRELAKKTCYPLHCTGDDGTVIPKGIAVQTSTMPRIKLEVLADAEISRKNFNSAKIGIAALEAGEYIVSLNGKQYKYQRSGNEEKLETLSAIANSITDDSVTVSVNQDEKCLLIANKALHQNGELDVSGNLAVEEVTSVLNFWTTGYGKIMIPYGIITEMVDNIVGFDSVTNAIEPTYGRAKETDIELRQSYLVKSALRSNTMIDSIVSELVCNVDGIESAAGYENCTDSTDEYGRPPHSIEIVVEGGDESRIAEAILRRKAGGIQTYGSNEVAVPGSYGDVIPIRFNRPQYLYAWVHVTVHGDAAKIPSNYQDLVKNTILSDGTKLKAGMSLYVQRLTEGIYDTVAGITYVDIGVAYSSSSENAPEESAYKNNNILVSMRQKILFDENRIEVKFNADS